MRIMPASAAAGTTTDHDHDHECGAFRKPVIEVIEQKHEASTIMIGRQRDIIAEPHA
jgi:hypothetical protein